MADDGNGCNRRVLYCFLLDTSGSMKYERISATNNMMCEIMDRLKSIHKSRFIDTEPFVTIISYNSEATLVSNPMQPLDSMAYRDVESKNWSDLDSALCLLKGQMEALNPPATKSDTDISIILFSDGWPTSPYEDTLRKLKNTDWFRDSHRLAVATGDYCAYDMLSEFTGDSDNVIRNNNVDLIISSLTSHLKSEDEPAPDCLIPNAPPEDYW